MCPQRFLLENNLKTHQKLHLKHLNASPKESISFQRIFNSENFFYLYKCQFLNCPYQSEHNFNVFRHIRNSHTSKMCSMCNQSLPNKKELQLHVKTIHNQFPCEECEYNSKCKTNLTRHNKTKHLKNEKINLQFSENKIIFSCE